MRKIQVSVRQTERQNIINIVKEIPPLSKKNKNSNVNGSQDRFKTEASSEIFDDPRQDIYCDTGEQMDPSVENEAQTGSPNASNINHG